jgi:hypothetical protein
VLERKRAAQEYARTRRDATEGDRTEAKNCSGRRLAKGTDAALVEADHIVECDPMKVVRRPQRMRDGPTIDPSADRLVR